MPALNDDPRTDAMPSSWILTANAALGSVVVAIGAWLAWNGLSVYGVAVILIAAAAFLFWRGRTLTLLWAWSTFLLGVECFAWPIVTMLRIHATGAEPSDDEMGAILSAIVMGLFSAVFWMAFSYGLFKRAKEGAATPQLERPEESTPAPKKR